MNYLIRHTWILCPLLIGMVFVSGRSQPSTSTSLTFPGKLDLSNPLQSGENFYEMETHLVNLDLKGNRTGKDIYKVYLKWVRRIDSGVPEDWITCLKFTISINNQEELSIPELSDWTYRVNNLGIDDGNQVFGIDHQKFENLKDENGVLIPIDKTYHIYNSFIDFHSICQVFAEPSGQAAGIQELKSIGQKVTHSASFSEPPVHLADRILEGSFFKNGEIVLELKGWSLVNGQACAVIGYDSGNSEFKMMMEPLPSVKTETVGSSHYWGELYKDLATNWVSKAILKELVVSTTKTSMTVEPIYSVAERSIEIRMKNQEKSDHRK